MPMYEYSCPSCKKMVEMVESVNAAPCTKCPFCGEETLQRTISRSFAMQFQGSGFYINDYGNPPKQQSSPHCHNSSCGCKPE